jgi:hypothetical protein
MLGNQKGLSIVGILVFAAIFGVVYVGYVAVPVIIDYYAAKEILAKTANMGYVNKDDDFLRKDCDRRMERANLPLMHGGCRVMRSAGGDSITATFNFEGKFKLVPTKRVESRFYDIVVTQNLTSEYRGGGF